MSNSLHETPLPADDLSTLLNGREASFFERARKWLGRNKTKIAIGVAACSAAATLSSNPVSELKDDVVDAAPWVAGGVAASEAAFVLGAGMMIFSIGDKVGNPLKVKSRIPEIAEKANNSALFKAGFLINTTGAVGDFVVISAGVIKEMPVQSYGILGLTLLDLGVTYVVRKAIYQGVNKNSPSFVNETE